MAGAAPAVTLSDSLRTGSVDRAIQFVSISVSASGNTELVAAVSGRRMRVLTYTIVVESAVDVRFGSGSSAITGAMTFGVEAEGVSAAWAPGGHFQTVAGEALVINLSAAVVVRGHLSYIEV